MRAHRHRRDEETVGDPRRRETVAHQLEDLPFAAREIDAPATDQRYPTPTASLAELLDQQRDQTARKRGLALQHAAQRLRKPYRVDFLEQVAAGAHAQCV